MRYLGNQRRASALLTFGCVLLISSEIGRAEVSANWCSGRGKEKMTLQMSDAEVTVTDSKGDRYVFVRGPSPGTGALSSSWFYKDKPHSTPFGMAFAALQLWQDASRVESVEVLVFLDRVFWPNCKRAFR